MRQTPFFKETIEEEMAEAKYFCIYCNKRTRDNGFFCSKCFNRPFFKRLRAFQKFQLKVGWGNPDKYFHKRVYEGREHQKLSRRL